MKYCIQTHLSLEFIFSWVSGMLLKKPRSRSTPAPPSTRAPRARVSQVTSFIYAEVDPTPLGFLFSALVRFFAVRRMGSGVGDRSYAIRRTTTR